MKNLINSFSEKALNPAKFIWQSHDFGSPNFDEDQSLAILSMNELGNNANQSAVIINENENITTKPAETFTSAEELSKALDDISKMTTDQLKNSDKAVNEIINKIENLYKIENVKFNLDMNNGLEQSLKSSMSEYVETIIAGKKYLDSKLTEANKKTEGQIQVLGTEKERLIKNVEKIENNNITEDKNKEIVELNKQIGKIEDKITKLTQKITDRTTKFNNKFNKRFQEDIDNLKSQIVDKFNDDIAIANPAKKGNKNKPSASIIDKATKFKPLNIAPLTVPNISEQFAKPVTNLNNQNKFIFNANQSKNMKQGFQIPQAQVVKSNFTPQTASEVSQSNLDAALNESNSSVPKVTLTPGFTPAERTKTPDVKKLSQWLQDRIKDGTKFLNSANLEKFGITLDDGDTIYTLKEGTKKGGLKYISKIQEKIKGGLVPDGILGTKTQKRIEAVSAKMDSNTSLSLDKAVAAVDTDIADAKKEETPQTDNANDGIGPYYPETINNNSIPSWVLQANNIDYMENTSSTDSSLKKTENIGKKHLTKISGSNYSFDNRFITNVEKMGNNISYSIQNPLYDYGINLMINAKGKTDNDNFEIKDNVITLSKIGLEKLQGKKEEIVRKKLTAEMGIDSWNWKDIQSFTPKYLKELINSSSDSNIREEIGHSIGFIDIDRLEDWAKNKNNPFMKKPDNTKLSEYVIALTNQQI